MIWPILEARAGMQKCFRSVFGSNENFKFAFEINRPLTRKSTGILVPKADKN